MSDYIDILVEGEDKDYYVRELAGPGWEDSKIGKILYKTLCALGIIRIYCHYGSLKELADGLIYRKLNNELLTYDRE